jgi:hypothetical protein
MLGKCPTLYHQITSPAFLIKIFKNVFMVLGLELRFYTDEADTLPL